MFGVPVMRRRLSATSLYLLFKVDVFCNGFLFIVEEFVLNICPIFMGECFTSSLLILEAYFTGFI